MCHKDSGHTLVIATIAIFFDFTMYSWMPWKTKKVSIEKAQICLVPIKEKIGILIFQLKWPVVVFFHKKWIIFKFRSLWEDCIQCILDFPTVHPNALNVPVVWEEDELVHHVLGRLVSKQLRVLVTCGIPSCQSESAKEFHPPCMSTRRISASAPPSKSPSSPSFSRSCALPLVARYSASLRAGGCHENNW